MRHLFVNIVFLVSVLEGQVQVLGKTPFLIAAAASCPELGFQPNVQSFDCQTSNGQGECTFTCFKNFKPKGGGKLTCTNGQWTPGKAVCGVPCPEPPMDKKSVQNLNCEETNGRDVCNFTCHNNLRPKGDGKLTCTNGQWTPEKAVCEASSVSIASCPEQMFQPNVQSIDCQTSNGQGVCTFTCFKNFKPKGDGKLTCTNGRWTPGEAVCEVSIASCPEHGFEPNVQSIDCKTSNGQGVCTFTCGNNLKPKGGGKLTCTNGRWTPEKAVCEDSTAFCPEAPLDQNVQNIMCEETNGQEVCTFTCHNNFQPKEGGKLTCTNGQWTPEKAVCEDSKASCPEPLITQNVQSLKCEEANGQGQCTFTCFKNFKPKGNGKLICTNGRWTPEQAVCEVPT